MADLNPPVTLTFDSQAEALEHFEVLRFVRLPVPGLVERWCARGFSDSGLPILTFASGTGRPAEDGRISYHLVEFHNQRDRSAPFRFQEPSC